MRDTLEIRFWKKVEKLPSGCWKWLAYRYQGYGRIGVRVTGRSYSMSMRSAHAVAYELLVGPIPVGKVLDHTCRNRWCVNPAHLEPKTNVENVMIGVGACACHARQTHCIHGHSFSGYNLIIRKGGGRTCRACGNRRNREMRARQQTFSGGNF